MKREYYKDSIANFRTTSSNEILGELVRGSGFAIEQTQRDAWLEEINILRQVLSNDSGQIHFEYAIPRMGKRIDVVLLIGPVIFVLEFKVGEREFTFSALDQVCDYALDLKNFHESSRDHFIAPVLIATRARQATPVVCTTPQNDKLLSPISCTVDLLANVIEDVLSFAGDEAEIDAKRGSAAGIVRRQLLSKRPSRYTKDIQSATSRATTATAINLSLTSDAISDIIRASKEGAFKSICFVTGVPGAGKTLVGLNTATKHHDKTDGLYSVFLSGNGPLVAILREALARDNVQNEKEQGRKVKKGEARSKVRAFIQNVHHFRDECLIDLNSAPIEHVALFDEAQRAWNLAKTSAFMLRKKNTPNFDQSEPEFLISCLDRHPDWAVIVCLVGGGQEINTGEAGITEWIESLNRSFPDWHIYISSRLTDSEYGAGKVLEERKRAFTCHQSMNDLHLVRIDAFLPR